MSELSKACYCMVMIADVVVVSMRVMTEKSRGHHSTGLMEAHTP